MYPFLYRCTPIQVPAMGSPLIEFMVEYRAYLGQIPACNGYINEFNLSCKSATNNSSDMSRMCVLLLLWRGVRVA